MELVVFSLELHYIQLLIGNDKLKKNKKMRAGVVHPIWIK